MNTRRACAFALLLLLAAAPATTDSTLAAAARTAAAFRTALGHTARQSLHRAHAVLIAPNGRAGRAILLRHTPAGWGEPAFYAAGALATNAPAILLIMTDRATDAILRQAGLTLDGPGALVLARLKTTPPTADLLLWSADPHARLGAEALHQDDAANASYYGHTRNAADIVGFTPPELRSSKLRAALGG